MQQPEDLSVVTRPSVALKRSLYGLKQASRMWYQKLQTVLIDIGFHCVEVDSSIYVFTGIQCVSSCLSLSMISLLHRIPLMRSSLL